MLNVIENHLESKYIDSYWLNNIILEQEKNRNKEILNNKYEEEIELKHTIFKDEMINCKKIIKPKERNYSESCVKFYTHKPYDSKKYFINNYQKRESLDKKDLYDKQSKPRIYEYTSKNKKSDILSSNRGTDIILKSWSRNNF
jgi:hypothetical protein